MDGDSTGDDTTTDNTENKFGTLIRKRTGVSFCAFFNPTQRKGGIKSTAKVKI